MQLQSHRQKDLHDPEMHLVDSGEIDDPNDPEYVAAGEDGQGPGQIFSGFVLNPFLKDGFFASSEELDRNKRLRKRLTTWKLFRFI